MQSKTFRDLEWITNQHSKKRFIKTNLAGGNEVWTGGILDISVPHEGSS